MTVVLFVVSLIVLVLAYLKGRKDERRDSILSIAEDINDSRKKQEAREEAHDDRVNAILNDPVDPSKYSRMLSSYPDKTPPEAKS